MKILIIKPSSLGDVIHSLPFLKALREKFQDAYIEWVISKNLKELLEGNSLINELIVFDKDSWKRIGNLPETFKETIGLIKRLKSKRYDMVIDLQGLLRSGLMAFFSPSPLRIGFKHAREGSGLFYNRRISVNDSLHAVDKYLEIARSLGARTDRVEFPLFLKDVDREKIKNKIGNLSEYVVIVPSARWESKRWPPENFGMLIERLPVPCVIIGNYSDTQTVQHVINSSNGKGINLCGRTSLREVAALIADAKTVISNDSGPMHLGVALRRPVVTLFGPTDPSKTGPYGWGKNKNLKVIKTDVPCSPCFKKRCKTPLCMWGISVERVLEEVKEFL
jgi:lipopolysaccharide heptosyltransferase I